jgi:hypothetical protein
LIKGFGLPRDPSAAVPVESGNRDVFDRSEAAE